MVNRHVAMTHLRYKEGWDSLRALDRDVLELQHA